MVDKTMARVNFGCFEENDGGLRPYVEVTNDKGVAIVLTANVVAKTFGEAKDLMTELYCALTGAQLDLRVYPRGELQLDGDIH